MMYPDNIEHKLGFDHIRLNIEACCESNLGVAMVKTMKISSNPEQIQRYNLQTYEFIQILEGNQSFPSGNLPDVSESLQRIGIEGVQLSASDLHDISISLFTIHKYLEFLTKEQAVYPSLFSLATGVQVETHIIKEIDAKIDDRGNIRNDASPELRKIRQQIQSEEVKIRKQLNSEIRNLVGKGYANQDATLTIRNGRMVIPVYAEFKRKVNGFIQDESASGQMVFIEPAAALEINNSIKDLEYQEKREIARILTQLTNLLRPMLPELNKAYKFLGMVDFIRAKARFGQSIQSNLPKLNAHKNLDWRNARHPLLFLAYRKSGKKVVPLNLTLHPEQYILVISGPNAGGKSVCLKTVGLLQYMYQCGVPISVDEGSEMCIFNKILLDIGDEQSLENDLSTYSSHLTNMKTFLKQCDEHSLFLIDEFGTGTDPNFGGVIAEVILTKLREKRAFGLINTHYGNLKQLADNQPGIVNGAMRFDMQKLEPLYQLEIGKPGSSFALEIAYKIGLPHALIEEVKSSLGEEKVNFDQMLARIERDKQYYDKKKAGIKKQEKELKSRIQQFEQLSERIKQNEQEIINQAKEKASQILQNSNQIIESTIKTIKETKADKLKTKAIRTDLDNFKEKIKPKKPKIKKDVLEFIPDKIEVGSYVKVKDQPAMGEVLSIRGKDAEIRIGSLTSKIKLNRLIHISKKSFKSIDKSHQPTSLQTYDITAKNMEFSSQVDLRGMRTGEAIERVDHLIDQAILLGAGELKIIHGKGDGILRERIRSHIKAYPQVHHIRDEHADRGGAGITIFNLD